MKIATNFEMSEKTEMLIRRIQNGDEVCTWSVQDSDYNNDIYCGTYNQAVKEAKRLIRSGCDIIGVALISLDSNLCFDFCHRCVDIDEF